MRVPAFLKILLPGMGVKRWFILSACGVAILAFGAFCLLGESGARSLYQGLIRYLPTIWRPAVGAALAASGLFALVLGTGMMVRGVLHAVSPKTGGSVAEALYQAKILKAAPNIVVVGGGTGLSNILRGIKHYTANLTAVVTVMDTGGSSGRLRRELDVLPPGDVRNCLLALAEDEERMAKFMQYRFTGGEGLAGHALGNLVLAGLEEALGGLDRAIEEASYFLSVRGQVVPSTLDKVHLVAELADGRVIKGEAEISSDPIPIKKIWLSQPAKAYERAVEAIEKANVILIGPGSLYTSIVPNLLVDGIAAAVNRSPAEKFVIMNLMTEPGETTGYTAYDHLKVLAQYLDLRRFSGVIVNTELPPPEILERYRMEGSAPVKDDLRGAKAFGMRVIRAPLLAVVEMEGKLTVKHDPVKLAKLLSRESKALRHSWTRWFSP
ncbi:MAG: uridine diphosphate-N-acetylglucosamine-binding protein YvcK [Candidatus Bipolaricaulota bacterium]|nr:uridine diphosphate-N-acetylglucosamine-binding protein YvcK [Candidatus Bipolaricaulota bacterium]MDW8127429.1 uridine diphosphate-N-acetylglucosamine-binding protein YvcK [Candidatus Bipolaricaulota bacterium]